MTTKVEELLEILGEKEEKQVDQSEEPESELKEIHQIGNSPFSKAAAFQRRETHPLVLDVLLLHRFGPSWLVWEPETVWSEIEKEFKATPSVFARNKINAVKTTHIVDSSWTEWEVFSLVVQAFTDNIPDFRTLQKPLPTQIIPVVNMLAAMRELPFSEEVGRFIAACFLDEGIFYLPPPVDFAQPYASMLRYRCTKCGRIDTDDDNEMCDSCGAPESLLEKTPTHDFEPVKARYDTVVKDGDNRNYWLQEDAVDVQVAKLMLARKRDDMYQKRLSKQMEALRG